MKWYLKQYERILPCKWRILAQKSKKINVKLNLSLTFELNIIVFLVVSSLEIIVITFNHNFTKLEHLNVLILFFHLL